MQVSVRNTQSQSKLQAAFQVQIIIIRHFMSQIIFCPQTCHNVQCDPVSLERSDSSQQALNVVTKTANIMKISFLTSCSFNSFIDFSSLPNPNGLKKARLGYARSLDPEKPNLKYIAFPLTGVVPTLESSVFRIDQKCHVWYKLCVDTAFEPWETVWLAQVQACLEYRVQWLGLHFTWRTVHC